MIELSDSEKIAYQMVTSVPKVSQVVMKADGSIDIKDLHAYMNALVRHMNYAEIKRRGNYVDVN